MVRRRKDCIGLTPNEEKFVEMFLTNGENATDAYRTSYSCPNMSTSSIVKEASRVIRRPRVAEAIAAARSRAVEHVAAMATIYAVDKGYLTQKLAGLFEQAVTEKAYAGAGRIGELLAKLQGLITEKRDVRMIRSMRDLTDDELADLAREGERSKQEGTRH